MPKCTLFVTNLAHQFGADGSEQDKNVSHTLKYRILQYTVVSY